MRNPLSLVALLYAAGLLLGFYLPLKPLWPLMAASGAAILVLLVSHGRRAWLCAFVVLFGWANYACQTAVLSPRDLRLLIGREIRYTTIRGILAETPVLRISQRAARSSERSVAQIQVHSILQKEQWVPAFGQIVASTPGSLDSRFFLGQQVEVTGVVQEPTGSSAPGQLDYRAYLKLQQIHYRLKCESTNDWRLAIAAGSAQTPTPPITDRFFRWAQATLAKGLPEQDQSLRLLWAMILGWKTPLTPEVAEPFMQSGTLHIFAISGLHIALIAGILNSLLRVMRVPRSGCGLIVVPLIWFYTAATGWQASAIRSTVMMSIILVGWGLERPSSLINSLAAAALIILIWEPTQLFQASFQLSFFVVLGLALIVPHLERLRQRWLAPDPLLPKVLRPRWKRWLDLPVGWLRASFATSLAAWLGSMPLIAYYFDMVTPNSLLANLVIVPLSSLALMSGLGSLVCGDWFSSGTVLFNHSSWFWMVCMMRASEWFAALPGAYFYVRQPGWLDFTAYYALLGAGLSGLLFKPRWGLMLSSVLSVLLAFCLLNWGRHCSTLRLTVLPSPAGSIFIDAPEPGAKVFLDSGDAVAAEKLVKPFLRSQGINRLPTLLLTQGDVRHLGGAGVIAEHFCVMKTVTGAVRSRSMAYRDFAVKHEKAGGWRKVARGEQVGTWAVLHPGAGDPLAQAADACVVLRGDCDGTRFLLVSSLGRAGQNALLNRETDLRADILITGMPAQGEPVIDRLLEAVQPSLLIVASAEYPAYVRPGRALRERLGRLPIPVIYTSDLGAAVLTFGGIGRWEVETMSGRRLSSKKGPRMPVP